ncbi:MAG: hypothetical protein R2821_01850 [Flavobacteriaceae bacterium]
MSIIIWQNFAQSEKGISARVINCLKDIPLRMISYGGSNYNLSVLVSSEDKIKALKLLNSGLFANQQLLNEVMN